ncbi:MAG: DNA translocase FtsK 4TM domain-containing protein [Alistipes sp.]
MKGEKMAAKDNERKAKQNARAASSARARRSSGDTTRWIAGVVVLLFGLFLLVAVVAGLLCYKHDYSLLHNVEDDLALDRLEPVFLNPCGKAGAQLAEYIVGQSFGLFGVLVPVIVIVLGVHLIIKKWRFLHHTILSTLFIMLLGSLTLGLAFGNAGNMFASGWGGAFGVGVALKIKGIIGIVGAWISVVVGWILTGVFINVNFINIMNNAGNAVIGQGGALVDKMAGASILHRSKNEADVPVEDSVSQRELVDETVAVPTDIQTEAVEADELQEELQEEQPQPIDDTLPAESVAERSGVKTILVEEHTEAQLAKSQLKHRPFDPDRTPNYKYPSADFLVDYISDSEVSNEEIMFNKRQIEETLGNFGIPIRDMKVTIGPTVTLYEIVQESGVKISRIQGLENDIAQSLKALGIRIIAPMPGRGTIGIEVPNRNKMVVSMRSAILSERFHRFGGELPVVIGRTIQNENYVFDLAKMPHLLVAGATGQGKSVGLNAIITSLLYRKDPSQLKFVLIDPKMVEFSLYAKMERQFLAKMSSEDEAIVTDPKKAVYTLNSLCIEMDNRLDKCRKAGARNIAEYNDKVRKREVDDENIMPYIVVIIDEFADLIMTAKEVEAPVMRLAQKARAIGIHLIVATQRPDVKVITGGIKANFPARIAFRVMQMIDSRTIIDQPGAERLIGRGDMLLSKDGELTRIQCALVETKEVDEIVDYISKQPSPTGGAYELPEYVESGSSEADSGLGSESSVPVKYDSLFAEIARDAVSSGQISTSYIQRNYEVGFNRAGRIMTQLERAGIVGPQTGAKQREIKFYDLQSLEAKLQDLGVY